MTNAGATNAARPGPNTKLDTAVAVYNKHNSRARESLFLRELEYTFPGSKWISNSAPPASTRR